MQPESTSALNYTCICGERVTVFNTTVDDGIPSSMTTSCRNGHVTTLTPEQIIALEWEANLDDAVSPAGHAA